MFLFETVGVEYPIKSELMIPSFDVFLFLVYFVYGLAFWGMGLTLMLESVRTPNLADKRVLRPLAIFGLIHGSHEWFEAYLLQAQSPGITQQGWLDWLRLGMLVGSFVPLLIYGIRIFKQPEQRPGVWWKIGLAGTFVYGLTILVNTLLTISPTKILEPAVLDVLSRYLLAVPGALLTALAFLFQARKAARKGKTLHARDFHMAAIGFGVYAISQLVVRRMGFFPANLLNTEVFRQLTGLPIQVLRSAMAIVITFSLYLATQRAEKERNEELKHAQQTRLEALERVQKELVEKEMLRRELLRHVVQAQEDERARIARELHDETAQTLAAFTLDLATLQLMAPDQPECKRLSTRLQQLSKEMSQGIYRLVHDLRPAQLDDLGLVSALQFLVDQDANAKGLRVKLDIVGKPRRFDAITETVLFRVTQEALANVVRHSQSKQAEVSLSYKTQEINLIICDSGIGFDPKAHFFPPRGWGLAGMRERVEAVGGELVIESSPGKGTLIKVTIPVFDLIP